MAAFTSAAIEMTEGCDPVQPPPVLAFDHLGVIVEDLESGREFLRLALGLSQWSAAVQDPGLGVEVQFGSAPGGAGPVYELVAPCGAGSPITGQLGRGKGVLNHVAYRTADLAASSAHLRSAGCFATAEPRPAVAYGGAPVQFWVSPLRFLIELIGKGEHTHTLTGEPFPVAERSGGTR